MSLIAVLGMTSAPAGADAPVDAGQAVTGSFPAVSGDGRLVVYAAPPTIADGRHSTIFLQDRGSSTTVELTGAAPGARLGDSVHPAISADGCVVAIVTEMPYDLFRDDDAGRRWDVYRLVLPACGGQANAWELVSASGRQSNATADDAADPTATPAISGSGSVIAYTKLVVSKSSELSTVVAVDLSVPLGKPGRARPVAGTPAEPPATAYKYLGQREPSVSDDGLWIAYTSDADSALEQPQWGTGPTKGKLASSQVFLWDRTNFDPATAVVRLSSTDVAADGEAGAPSLSGDGQYVAFTSTSTNLVPSATFPTCAATCVSQVYRYARVTGALTLVSKQTGATDERAVAADAPAVQPAITDDGSTIAFITRASNLFPTPSDFAGVDEGDVVLATLPTDRLDRLSVRADGVTPAPGSNSHVRVSATGRSVVYDSAAASAGGAAGPAPTRLIQTVTLTPHVSVQDLDIGTTAVGFASPEWFVSVVNQGPSSFEPAAVLSTNPQFVVTGGTCQQGYLVQPGGSCTVKVMLTPVADGPVIGNLVVGEGHFGAINVAGAVIGSGGYPALDATPGGAGFGSVKVGSSSDPTSFQVTNVGFGPADIANVVVVGDNPDDFVVASSSCLGASLAAGTSCSVDVVFAPTASGYRTAIINVNDSLGEYTSILVNGAASYSPDLAAAASTVVAGVALGIGGTGFAPSSRVSISFSDASQPAATATTDERGGFLVVVPIGANERPGQRTLVAQAATGEVAEVNVEVRPRVDPPRRLPPSRRP